MLLLRMPYVGMISIIVGVTNLIPTFGPVIGAVFGGFILLAIPVAAICDFSYREGILPYLKSVRQRSRRLWRKKTRDEDHMIIWSAEDALFFLQ